MIFPMAGFDLTSAGEGSSLNPWFNEEKAEPRIAGNEDNFLRAANGVEALGNQKIYNRNGFANPTQRDGHFGITPPTHFTPLKAKDQGDGFPGNGMIVALPSG
jgi:hypothetical protein